MGWRRTEDPTGEIIGRFKRNSGCKRSNHTGNVVSLEVQTEKQRKSSCKR